MKFYKITFFVFICLLSSCESQFDSQNSASEALGEKKFAIVLLDYVNDGTAPPVKIIRDGFFDTEYSVSEFISAASYEQTTITGDIFGWIIPNKPLFGDGWTACWPLDRDRFNLLLDNYPNVNLTNYDGFIFYVYRKKGLNCAAGVSNTYGLEPRPTYTEFGDGKHGIIDTRILYFATDFYFPYQPYSRITNSTVAHEIIHALGISGHSNSYICGDQILSENPDDCTIQGYGDIFSIMGLRSQSSYPNSVISERLGWLDEYSIITVDTSGQYIINNLENQTDNVKAIKIPLHNPIPLGTSLQIDSIYLEYHSMTGFNERNSTFRNIKLQDGTYQSIENIHGALVYAADCSTYDYCLPFLLNMHPHSVEAAYAPKIVANAYQFEGESFEIPQNNIQIEVVALNEDSSLTVDVQLDNRTVNQFLSMIR